MERLQGPIDPCFFGEHLDFQCLEQGLSTTESLRFEEEEEAAHLSIPSLEDKMPFLQMLQTVNSPPPYFPLKEPSFQALLRLQHLKNPWELGKAYMPEMETQLQTALEIESCVTHDMVELHSPVKSEAKDLHNHPHSVSAGNLEAVSSDCIQDQEQPNSAEINCRRKGNNSSGSPPPTWAQAQNEPEQTQYPKSPPVTRERRKRKRTRPTKNKEEVESQRMTHIAVERNRRRQMNDHLNVLRSLMPTSYIQRGDQASIVGGAIDFVKELEQLLQSLEAQKRMRRADQGSNGDNSFSSSSSSSSASMAMPSNGMFMSLSQCRIGSHEEGTTTTPLEDEVTAQNKSEAADIDVTVIQTHVNLKIQCQRRAGQLMKAILALEDLRLAVLHLNITSSQDTVLYSFNLKIEEGCKLGSADEIARAVHQIFSFINGCS
ncbi:PREDICTED: transcription factor bHLH67 [Prunus mume]|uniref:Transcription factor bHLH67 n=1 Tax=Prunus mume TaxID=102107 RepID=A0ABM0PTG0_PRUMU|nr:PREDICTED: transcription factor bHLH67 [Prunus mume]